MASSSGMLILIVCGENRGANSIRGCRDTMDANTDGVVNGIEDGRSGGNYGLLTDAFGAERADGRGVFDEDGFDGGHVADRRNEVIVQVFAFTGKELFHESVAQTLSDTAFDLAFDESGIDGAADIVGGGDLQYTHGT